MSSKGNGAPEIEANYLQAHTRCEQSGETEQLFPILGGLITARCLRRELAHAHTVREKYLSLAQQKNDPPLWLEVFMILGSILLWRRELNAGRVYFE